MVAYQAPLRDMRFVLHHLAQLDRVMALTGAGDSDLIDSVLEEAAKIAQGVIAPLNVTGDQTGAHLENGVVRTPPGWREAYQTLVEGNWLGLPFPADYGGLGLPWLVNAAVSEMCASANMAFALSLILTQGAAHAIRSCASEAQKALYLPKLVSGVWSGTMMLTEAGAGSDLGALRTRATREDDHYRLRGQKIYITYGDHDLSENIIHLVLARTEDAPPGVKGISLFIVPKFLVDGSGKLRSRNEVHAVSLEHKIGIHASPTAVMALGDSEGAIGYLVGEENRGLEYMFVMMNNARLNVGLQGVAIAERAYQAALSYARERVQGKPPLEKGAPPARHPIIDHPDVRRMLMTMRARIEAMRALAYVEAAALDIAEHEPTPEGRAEGALIADFLNPIVKGWCTESAVQIASTGIQIHGGMGYIEETGAAQHWRDSRITPIYEGTTAIQANDLVGRKILKDGGKVARQLLAEVTSHAQSLWEKDDPRLQSVGGAMAEAAHITGEVLDWILTAGNDDPRLPSAAAVPLLMLFGTLLGGHHMARAAAITAAQNGSGDAELQALKPALAHHYAQHVLPEALSWARNVTEGAKTVMGLPADLL